MSCKSHSVEDAEKNSSEAVKVIADLQATIESQDAQNRASFEKKVTDYYKLTKITDATPINENRQIKTEYASEFSLKEILGIVTAVLKIVAEAVPSGGLVLTQDTIGAYGDLVNSVAEASKSSSAVTASLTFSGNRIVPGIIALVSASTQSIKNQNLFGSEAITTTTVYYRIIQSIDDIKTVAAFGEAQADLQTILAFKTLQVALVDDVKTGHITMEDWFKKDDSYTKAIDVVKARLAAAKLPKLENFSVTHKTVAISKKNKKILISAIDKLAKEGSQFLKLIEVSRARIEHGYF